LAFSGRLITLTIGIRFLTDYLAGDTYFRTAYEDHNLVRCRTQLKMVQSMEDQRDEYERIVRENAK
ncbi:MAG: mucin-desulfating sulfatase, partial [Kiritimatiellae bacterium]|nr:mucin-desulfating sulfatase [Kiritimatiellia bacterium]